MLALRRVLCKRKRVLFALWMDGTLFWDQLPIHSCFTHREGFLVWNPLMVCNICRGFQCVLVCFIFRFPILFCQIKCFIYVIYVYLFLSWKGICQDKCFFRNIWLGFKGPVTVLFAFLPNPIKPHLDIFLCLKMKPSNIRCHSVQAILFPVCYYCSPSRPWLRPSLNACCVTIYTVTAAM